MAAQLANHHFAGAVVVIVENGQVAFKKGYGFADFTERKPVDPTRTLFRVASNTKMFTWTAVMQLAEQGKLDLKADVNTYLKGIQIPPTFPQPITLEHLMTHTAGFEDRVFGLFVKTPDKMRPLVDLMREEMPARVFAPGTVPAYSNYGTALAGLIVEQVSGVPYAQYVEDRILTPLGMTHAAVRQPVPANLAADLSKGYRWSGGRLREQPFEYVPWAPAGGMSISGEDMGRFMLAHLGDGRLGEARILRPETARVMRGKLMSFSPKINGMLHGFMERNANGQEIFGHGGTTAWFHSRTAMLPAHNLGVFVAYNTDSGAAASDEFSLAFFDHYFPTLLDKEPAISKDSASNLQRFVGSYVQTRVSESDLTKAFKLAAATVSIDPTGYLVLGSVEGVTRWRQIEPLVFAEVDGKRRLVFRENERGEVIDVCASPVCVVALLKQPSWKGITAQLSWLGTCLAVMAIALIGIPVAAVSQRRMPKPFGAKLTRVIAWVTSLMFVAGLGTSIAGVSDINGTILFGTVAPPLRIGLTLFVIGAVLSLILIILTFAAWKKHWWHTVGRVCVTLISTAAIGVVIWLSQWNLLGWRY